jgi:hypothetical protein
VEEKKVVVTPEQQAVITELENSKKALTKLDRDLLILEIEKATKFPILVKIKS